ncbi:MAG: L-methionine (R)-S-oxide reductase, partial [Epulopiscium sp.]|nr:L-methionine (R)-S-oxide reductase [Candidatus Epulonipiscium sp.]
GLIDGETDFIANLSNASAILFDHLENVNWSGFYLYKDHELVLGPFQGKPACVRIPIGKGVCGTAAKEQKSIIVEDVHKFEGHIACDEATASEIVIPMIKDEKFLGVLDIDSPVKARFSEEDEHYLSKFVAILLKGSNV